MDVVVPARAGRHRPPPPATTSFSTTHRVRPARRPGVASGGWTICTLSSRNDTTVQGERLLAERALRAGDEIRVGATRGGRKGAASNLWSEPPPAARGPVGSSPAGWRGAVPGRREAHRGKGQPVRLSRSEPERPLGYGVWPLWLAEIDKSELVSDKFL
jgi:hypothetical protein